jgi:DNA-binding HxlR family transcriptional regulator
VSKFEREIIDATINILIKNNLINKTRYRNYLIKQEYEALRKANTVEECEKLLSDKYYLSIESIHKIIYSHPR